MGWMRNSTVAVILAIIALVVIAFVVKTQFLKTEEKKSFISQIQSRSNLYHYFDANSFRNGQRSIC